MPAFHSLPMGLYTKRRFNTPCHGNNSRENFIGLCPNHHEMMHDSRYSAETEEAVREKLRLRAQADANSLQYCNNQSIEKIADGNAPWQYELLSECKC